MTRYIVFVLIVLASAATAIAAIAPAARVQPIPGSNVTVIEKNQVWPVLGPLMVAPCKTEDCSDT